MTRERRMGRRREDGRETVDVDTAVAVDRFLSSPALSEATRRAYAADLRDFSRWLGDHGIGLDDLDVRVLAAYTAELGRARRGLAPTTIARRLSAVRSLARHALGPARVPDAALAPRRGGSRRRRRSRRSRAPSTAPDATPSRSRSAT